MKLLPRRASARNPAAEMGLMEHLEELRDRLIKVAIAFALACLVAWFLYRPILEFLIQPLTRLPEADQILRKGQLIYSAPTEAFFIRLKVTAFSAFVMTLPVILWQLWRFVTPGLHPHEKRYAVPFIVVSLGLFIAGILLAFYTLPKALEVLTGFAGQELVLLPRASDYLSFVLVLIAGFGLAFEFPVVLIALVLVGVLSTAALRKGRRMAWVILLIAAAVITPTQDPITLAMMAVPLGLLYEATILTARLLKK